MRRALDPLLTALAVAWLAAVAVIKVAGVDLTPPDIGASPDTLVAGDVGRLLSSSLIVDADVPLLQLALLATVTAVVIVRHGPRLWWAAALVGHVGSALIAYALIAIGIELGISSAEQIADDWDYGISCVMAAQFGVLFAGSLRRLRGRRGGRGDALLLAGTSIALLGWLATIDWYGIEHPIAFALGAAVLVRSDRHRDAAAVEPPRAADATSPAAPPAP